MIHGSRTIFLFIIAVKDFGIIINLEVIIINKIFKTISGKVKEKKQDNIQNIHP